MISRRHNTASMAAMVAFPNMAAYCAAKGGVKQLTKTAAVEYAAKGIRANAICPGTIKTAITAETHNHSTDEHDGLKRATGQR